MKIIASIKGGHVFNQVGLSDCHNISEKYINWFWSKKSSVKNKHLKILAQAPWCELIGA